MDRDSDRNDENRHEGDRFFQEAMLFLRSLPSQSKDSVKPLPFPGVISQKGDIRIKGR